MAILILLLAQLFCLISAGYVDYSSVTGLKEYTAQDHRHVSYTYQGTLIIESLDEKEEPPTSNSVPDAATTPTLTSSNIKTASTAISHAITSAPTITRSGIATDDLTPTLTCETSPEYQDLFKNRTRSWPYASFSSASCCDDLHRQWSSLSSEFLTPYDSRSLLFTTWSSLSWHTRHFTMARCDGPFTTLCDGIPRAMCSPSIPQPAMEVRSDWFVQSSLINPSQTSVRKSLSPSFPVPSPNCTVTSNDCTRLWEDLADTLGEYNKNHGLWDEMDHPDASIEPSPPTENPQCSALNNDACLACGVHNETVEILYWPGEADEASLCRETTPESSGVTTPRQVVTAKWGSYTLTSPTVYAYYTMMRDEMGCGSWHTNVLVPINPMEVSTMVFRAESNTLPFASRVNFGHFAYKTHGSLSYPLIPQTAYCGDERFGLLPEDCSTIYHDYMPGIAFRIAPEVLSSIDPAWRYCRNGQFMAFDPPIALTGTTLALPEPTLQPFPKAEPSPYPAATHAGTQAAPYPLDASGSTNSDDPPNRAPNILPGVTVSKISLFTVYASQAGAGAGLSWAGVTNTGGSSGRNLPMDAEYQNHGDPSIQSAGLEKQAVITLSGQTFTAKGVSPDVFVIGGSTVRAGGNPITVNGAIVSAFIEGVVVDASPESASQYQDPSKNHGSPKYPNSSEDPNDPKDPDSSFVPVSGIETETHHGELATPTTRRKKSAGQSRIYALESRSASFLVLGSWLLFVVIHL